MRGPETTGSSARILAVDDETSTAQALAERLVLWGHKVETAGDGTDALKKAAEFRPDVVLSDLAMPETDGLWLLRALKDDLPDCPVIFLTGPGPPSGRGPPTSSRSRWTRRGSRSASTARWRRRRRCARCRCSGAS